MRRLLPLLFASLASLAACEDPAPAKKPSATCERAGERCQLAPGKLGVCMQQADGKIACMSQH